MSLTTMPLPDPTLFRQPCLIGGEWRHAVAKIEEHIADARQRGAQVLCGGSRHALGGTFFEPTVMTGVTQSMLDAREQTFAPLAGVA